MIKKVYDKTGSQLELLANLKKVVVTGNTSSGSNIQTTLSTDDIVIISCICNKGYKCVPWKNGDVYNLSIMDYMQVTTNNSSVYCYAYGGRNNIDVEVTVYYIEIQ